jgi:hypothetical protein
MQKVDCPEEKFKWEFESVCIENITATLLHCDSPCNAFPECDEKNFETYLVFLYCPTLAVECIF